MIERSEVSEPSSLQVDWDETNDELSLFIASSIRGIARGVQLIWGEVSGEHDGKTAEYFLPEAIDFDVAVEAKRALKGQGGVKLAVFSTGANLAGEKSSEQSHISRIKFQVPLRGRI